MSHKRLLLPISDIENDRITDRRQNVERIANVRLGVKWIIVSLENK